MRKDVKTQAEIFRLGMIIGLIHAEEISIWADSVVLNEREYDDVLLELTFAKRLEFSEIISALSKIQGIADIEIISSEIKELIKQGIFKRIIFANDIIIKLSDILEEESLPKIFRDGIYQLQDVAGLYNDGLHYKYNEVEGALFEVLLN